MNVRLSYPSGEGRGGIRLGVVRLKTFLDRPIEGDWACLWTDATKINARQNGRIVSVAPIAAVGANTEGRREILAMEIGRVETEWGRRRTNRRLPRIYHHPCLPPAARLGNACKGRSFRRNTQEGRHTRISGHISSQS
jgi:hypothetical protein